MSRFSRALYFVMVECGAQQIIVDEAMSHKSQPTPNLRKLDYSPLVNPLEQLTTVAVQRRYVLAERTSDPVEKESGEVHGVSIIKVFEEFGNAEFIRAFIAGVKASYDLNNTAVRVFQAVLKVYQHEGGNGFAGYVNLYWHDNGPLGLPLGMSLKTFQRGLKDLLTNRIIYPKQPNVYWVNPAIFFEGGRVAFVSEFLRKEDAI